MKKWYSAGLLLLLFGLALFVSGWQGSGRNLSAIDGSVGSFTMHTGSAEELVKKSETIPASKLRRIHLEEDTAAVRIVPSADGDVHLSWQETEDDPLTVSLSADGRTLTIERGSSTHIGINFSVGGKRETVLQLPKGLELELNAHSDTGSVSGEELRLGGSCRLDTDTGAIRLERSSAEALSAESSTGSIRLTELQVEGELTAETDTGSITLENVAAGEIRLESDTGSIRGTLAGRQEDYRIRAHSDTGRCSLPADDDSGSLPLTVETDTGAIDLSFEAD